MKTHERIVTVQGAEVRLTPPGSDCLIADVLAAAGTSHNRAAAAALGACWRSAKRPRTKMPANYSMLAYGGAVWDELRERGVAAGEILVAGASAYSMLAEVALPSEAEVATHEGNSDGQEEG
jgi:hypothetical protein